MVTDFILGFPLIANKKEEPFPLNITKYVKFKQQQRFSC